MLRYVAVNILLNLVALYQTTKFWTSPILKGYADDKINATQEITSFPMTDDSHCNWINSSLTTVHCFDSSNVGKQVVWKY